MNWQIIQTLVAKDLALYFKNRFIAFITLLGLVAYVALYFLLPDTLNETLDIAMFAPELPTAVTEQLQELSAVGFDITFLDSKDGLETAVGDGDYPVGLAFPADLLTQLAANQKPTIDIYFDSDVPPEFRDLYVLLVDELGYALTGQTLTVETNEEILGPDLAGQQIAFRNRLLPLIAVIVLIMETMGLASLISMEVQSGTLRAILVTPTRTEGLFLSKTITGVILAFVQAALVLAITGGLKQQPVLMLTAVFLGAVLVTGIAFLIATVARDMMSVIGWGMLALIILIIPTLSIMLPGLVSDWIKIIPSYYLVETVHQVINFGAGWGDVSANLLILAAFALAFLALGALALRRKFQ